MEFLAHRLHTTFVVKIKNEVREIYPAETGMIFSELSFIGVKNLEEDIYKCNGYVDIMDIIYFDTEEDINRYISILETYSIMKKLRE